MIDFDVKVLDEEGAIRTDRVLLEVRKSNGKLVSMKEIEINKDYKQLNFDKLDKDENYVFKFIGMLIWRYFAVNFKYYFILIP